MTERPNNLFNFIGSYTDFCFQTNLTKGLFVIYFYASWSPDCLKVGEKLIELARENPKVTFYSIDVDQSKDIVNLFSINSFPTIKILNKTRLGVDDAFTFIGADQHIQVIIQDKIKDLMTNYHY